MIHTIPNVFQWFLFWNKLSSSSTQPRICALSVRNQDRLVFKQNWDLWDSCLVSCWTPQATHVRTPSLLQNSGKLPFCAITFTLTLIPHRERDISQVLFITNTACQLPLFCFFYSHTAALSLSLPESPHWVKQKTSPSTSRISSGFQSLNSPSKWCWSVECVWIQGIMTWITEKAWGIYMFQWLL